MPNTSGNARNLNDSRAQALQALENVSERLGEILGGEVPEDGTHRNENGELVNEEGLPIIDITEPIDDLDTPSLSAATEEDEVIEEDNYPEPISKLSPEALAISRRHRDKILELLAEEEARDIRRTRQEQQAELERKRKAARSEMQKRMVTQSAELEKRRKAKDLERKMARALISGLGDPEPPPANKVDPKPLDKKEKKSVTFANAPAPTHAEQPAEAVTWGDVVPGKLSEKPTHSRSQPMKMEVVERSPAPKPVASEPIPPLEEQPIHKDSVGDSDDESDTEVYSDSIGAFESGDEDVVLSAHHHRELALEYHRRREALASNADAIRLENTGSNDAVTGAAPYSWDNENVPLEATLAHLPPKPQVSKFKASLVNSHFEPTPASRALLGTPSNSHPSSFTPSFGTSVLPPSALAESIKMGKLVDGKLVAREEEEDDVEREAREEEEIRKLLLKSMENYSGIAAQVMGPAGSYWADTKAEEAGSSSNTIPPPSKSKTKPKASRFKVNRTQPRDALEDAVDPTAFSALSIKNPTTVLPTVRSGSITPMSSAERSSPKLTQRERSLTPNQSSVSPSLETVIDSPSFMPLKGSPLRNVRNVVESPSFQHGSNAHPSSRLSTAVIDSPSFPATPNTIVESPSFMRPTGPSSRPQAPPLLNPPSVVSAPSDRPAGREPNTMTDDVVERSTNRDSGSGSSAIVVKPQRISRFKAERSGES